MGLKFPIHSLFKIYSSRTFGFIAGALLLLFSILFAIAPTSETASWINLKTSKQQGYLGLSRVHPAQIKFEFNADNLKMNMNAELFSWGNLRILRKNSVLALSMSGKEYVILTQSFDIENLSQILVKFRDNKLIIVNKINDSSKIVAFDTLDTTFSSGYWRIYQDNAPTVESVSVLPQAYKISNTNYRRICLLIICLLNLFLFIFIQQRRHQTTALDEYAK